MTFDPSDYYGDDKVLLTVEGEYHDREIEAYCCPDANGRTFLLGGELDLETSVDERFGAPFRVDVVVHSDQYPEEGDMQDIRAELGDAFEEQFHAKVDAVHEKISDSDDPLDTILDLEPEDLD